MRSEDSPGSKGDCDRNPPLRKFADHLRLEETHRACYESYLRRQLDLLAPKGIVFQWLPIPRTLEALGYPLNRLSYGHISYNGARSLSVEQRGRQHRSIREFVARFPW
jgi:hypothetical protein